MFKILITLIGNAKEHGGGTNHTSTEVVEFDTYSSALAAISSVNSHRTPNGAVSLTAVPLFKVC